MQGQRRYKKAPIKEAIIDFRASLPEEISLEKLSNIGSIVRDDFPKVEPFYRGIGALHYQPGESFKVDTSEQQIGFWFRSEDNLQTFQVTLEGFAFNRLAPYESWEVFSGDAKRLWEVYKEVCRPTYVTRAAIRYINQINIPANQLIELKDYLRTVPEVSPDLSQNALQTFFMQLQIPQKDLNCMLIINQAIAQPVNPDFVTIVFDLDLFRQEDWKSNSEEIWRFLDKLRDRKNEVFEASITDKTRELID